MICEGTAPVARIVKEEEAIIVWDDGEESVFPHSWLWANAPENGNFPAMHKRTSRAGDQDMLDMLSPWSVCIEYDETLVISWAGLREVNRFPLLDLRSCQPIVESAELALAAD